MTYNLRMAFSVMAMIAFIMLGSVDATAKPAAAFKFDSPLPVTTPIGEALQKQLQSLVAPATGTAAPAANSDESDDAVVEPVPTLGTRSLNLVIGVADILRQQGEAFITNFAALPQLSDWLKQQETDPRLQARWIELGNDVVNFVLIPLFGAVLLEILLFPVRLKLRRREPTRVTTRVAIVGMLLVLRAIPIIGFTAAAATLIDQNEPQKLSRFILFNIVYAFTLCRIIITLLRGLLAPTVAGLRVLPITTDQAAYIFHWARVFVLLIICSYFVHDVTQALHVPPPVITAFGNILALVLVGMMITVIAQKRAFVATLLRADLSAAQPDLSVFQSFRLWLARRWHILTITYLVIGYAIAALGVANGFTIMLRGTLLTFLILVAIRFIFLWIDRAVGRSSAGALLPRHAFFRGLARIAVWGLAILGFAMAWGLDIASLFATPLGQRVLGSLFSIGITILLASFGYEMLSRAIDRRANPPIGDDEDPRDSARIRTLLPMIRNIMFMVFASIFAIVLLSEVGINVAPLLAGAGVLGVAVGFGSQTLVKDFLTGFFIVVENTMAIGDVVKIGDNSGVVESIGIRSLRLRDSDGSLHTLPFSEVSKITNMTKDFGGAVIEANVAYDTDLHKAMQVIEEIAEEMRNDPNFARMIIGPFEMWGVDKLGDYAISIKGRLRTRPGKHWEVRRAFLLRLKQRFDKEGIVLPYPTVSQVQHPVNPVSSPTSI